MRRRTFITLFGTAAVLSAGPLPLSAQQPKRPRIGVLVVASPESFLNEFREGLRAQGYIEGRNIQLEVRSADGNANLLRGLADELVKLKVDIIVASLTPAISAAKQATSEIPIVMALAGDPVGTGFVASLARPGGNITGLSGMNAELGAKLLEITRGMLPSTQRVAVLANAADPFTKPFLAQIEEGGRAFGIAIQAIPVHGVAEFAGAFAAMAKERADAVIVQPSLPRKAALDMAMQQRLPPISMFRVFASEGGLMSYSGSQSEQFRRTAYYIHRILNGAKPADLPVEQPTRFELVLNLSTAKALGIEVPAMLLAIADEVIE